MLAIASNPPISYLYPSAGCSQYRFHDPEMERLSFIPAIEIGGKKIVFTFNGRLALYYDQSFIYSLKNLFEKITLPQRLSQELLDKIATIANYLSTGKKYEYVAGTARTVDPGMVFLVKSSNGVLQGTIPSLREEIFVHYSPYKGTNKGADEHF